MYSCFKLVCK